MIPSVPTGGYSVGNFDSPRAGTTISSAITQPAAPNGIPAPTVALSQFFPSSRIFASPFCRLRIHKARLSRLASNQLGALDFELASISASVKPRTSTVDCLVWKEFLVSGLWFLVFFPFSHLCHICVFSSLRNLRHLLI